MRQLLSLRGTIAPTPYALAAAMLILSQHAAVVIAFLLRGEPFRPDTGFWLLPLRRLALLPDLPSWGAALGFALGLAVAWALAVLSFRRAAWSGWGHALAAAVLVPGVQMVAASLLTILPVDRGAVQPEVKKGADLMHVVQGVLAGVAIVVLAVFVSAIGFGSYGWGLFVLTPFMVGMSTGYLANRRMALTFGRTSSLVLAAAALGAVALVALALEGLVCILMAAPLGAAAAVAGGAIGRGMALVGHRRGRPLLGVAIMPVLFAAEAVMPPTLAMTTHETIDVAAPPAAVWIALTDGAPIASPPGPVGWAGLAYAVRGQLLGEGVGAERLGVFSTGIAREVVTDWRPGRQLTFAVLSQPPAMEEMSPYRRVHAPHVQGYFDTVGTGFDLRPLPGGGTRLTARASHVLRIEPVLYWEPLARWAIRRNVGRVLRDVKEKAERRSR